MTVGNESLGREVLDLISHDDVSRVTIADEYIEHCWPCVAVDTTANCRGNWSTASDDVIYDCRVVSTLYTFYATVIVTTNESAVNLNCNTVVVSVVGLRCDTMCAVSIDLNCICVTAEEDVVNAEISSCNTVN